MLDLIHCPPAAVPELSWRQRTRSMHPEIRQDHPGNCPKCGMTLEPVLPELDEAENPELVDFKRRFWWMLPVVLWAGAPFFVRGAQSIAIGTNGFADDEVLRLHSAIL